MIPNDTDTPFPRLSDQIATARQAIVGRRASGLSPEVRMRRLRKRKKPQWNNYWNREDFDHSI